MMYRFIEWIGRWSMLDVFVIAILVALVNFGTLARVEADLGAMAFASVVILTMLAAMTTGSGNAPFYAFVEMIPKLAHSSGINPAYLSIPMLQASNLGRTISPVSGVVVAVAGMAKISPFEVVKRTSVPVMVGLLVVIVATELLVPGSAVH